MIRTLFQDIKKTIIDTIDGAQSEVIAAVAWFTDRDIFQALWNAAERQVKVHLIFLDHEINWESSLDYEALTKIGATVYTFPEGEGIMHHKFCIVDRRIIIAGSYNWTYRAANYNKEMVIVFEGDDAPVSDFLEEFEKLQNHPDTRPLGIASAIPPDTTAIAESSIKKKLLTDIRLLEAEIPILIKPSLPSHLIPDIVFVEGGMFWMGSEDREGEKPVHQVTLDSFRIGKYPVTFEEYNAFCEATGRKKPDDTGWGRGSHPVVNVCWYDAIEYCNWLSRLHNLEEVYQIDKTKTDPNNFSHLDSLKWLITADWKANGWRLPTEAEWEFAARGRQEWFSQYSYSGSDHIEDVGWYHYERSSYQTHPVGQKLPNEIGLYDMSGNVSEMCWNWWTIKDFYEGFGSGDVIIVNPIGLPSGSSKAVRGGSILKEYYYDEEGHINDPAEDSSFEVGYYRDYQRVIQSYGISPMGKSCDVGFRIVKTV